MLVRTLKNHRFVRFSAIGGVATLLHISIAFLTTYMFNTPVILANTLGFLIAFVLSFTGHYRWTFSLKGQVTQAMWRFLCVALLAFSANLILMHLIHLYSPATVMGLRVLVSIGIMPFVSYTLGRLWAFSQALQ
jgi:putative flippase GtrA